MEIVYGKTLTLEETEVVNKVATECDILFDTARLLFYRGIDTVKKAKDFLSPGKKGFINPFLLSGMRDAVNRINVARNSKEKVLIFGDYDADGICASTILYYSLKEFGVECFVEVPEREEGYGLNVDKILQYKKEHDVTLLITVDCGISEYEKIEVIKSFGVDVIVTDHHEPPEILPGCIKINPKLKNQEYSFDGLCGAGVAYKLGYAIIGEDANKYLDFASLATVADSMDLIGENRDIVVEGLKIFNSKNIRPQFKYLLGENTRQVTAQTLAYAIAPRINAGGRMGDAHTALKLFLADNESEIFHLTAKLVEYNYLRQTECDNIYREAREKILAEGLERDNVILVCDEKWSAGFIGIVAAKLVEDFNKPVIVFAGHEEGYYKGSARSVDGINIYDAIFNCKDYLIGFGGHSQAAGVSVEKDKYLDFRKAINSQVKSISVSGKKIYAEWNISGEFPLRFAREIDRLEPFGVANKRPLFSTEVEAVESLPIKTGSSHYTYKTQALEMLDFNGQGNVFTLALPIKKKIVFEVNVSVFRNKESIKGYARTLVADYGDYSSVDLEILENELKKIQNGNAVAVPTYEGQIVRDGYGTMFAVSDPETLKLYPELKDLPLFLFSPQEKSSVDFLIVSPKCVPEGYDKVIYLDLPASYLLGSAKSYVNDKICGYRFIEKLSVKRENFTEYFVLLKELSGKTFTSASSFTRRYLGKENLYQAVFAITVFLELGIFSIENGRFAYNEKVKNPLTNSSVYSKIYSLKG